MLRYVRAHGSRRSESHLHLDTDRTHDVDTMGRIGRGREHPHASHPHTSLTLSIPESVKHAILISASMPLSWWRVSPYLSHISESDPPPLPFPSSAGLNACAVPPVPPPRRRGVHHHAHDLREGQARRVLSQCGDRRGLYAA